MPVRVGLFAVLLPLLIACRGDRGVTGPGEPRVQSTLDAGPSLTVTLSCGQSVVTSVKLGADMTCTGDALLVEADGIDIDLNGHTITGSGAGNGITVRAREHVTIRGGTIAGFTSGIFVASSHHVLIRSNRFTQNREAVFLNGSSDNVIKENEAWQNGMRGFMIRPTLSGGVSTRNLLVENTLRENPIGVLIVGQAGNTLKENRITQSSVAAVDLSGAAASANVIKENRIKGSSVGVRFAPGWTGNSLIENRFLGNVCALQGSTAGNTVEENVFAGNGSNSC